MPKLSEYFDGIMVKRLTAVEVDTNSSNQHEITGTRPMKDLLGLDKRTLMARFMYLGQDDDSRLILDGILTWYDARANHATRSEHRLYFKDNAVMDEAVPGDVLIFGLQRDGTVVMLIVAAESYDLADVLWLFGASHTELSERKAMIDPAAVERRSLSLFNSIAETIGLDVEQDAGDEWLDLLLSRFGPKFPATRALSALARETLTDGASAVEAPDSALIGLMDQEELLFRQLERHIVSKYLEQHAGEWAGDVDAFVKYSLSVQNRRKSRAGFALENQLEWIFRDNGIRFDREAVTEKRNKPDFLFPGAVDYHDNDFPAESLTMLGVKTSCKERWRQVLKEADRISGKHLLTMQPTISENQTDQMRADNLSLVVPAALHADFTPKQQSWLLSLHDFIDIVRRKERCLTL